MNAEFQTTNSDFAESPKAECFIQVASIQKMNDNNSRRLTETFFQILLSGVCDIVSFLPQHSCLFTTS